MYYVWQTVYGKTIKGIPVPWRHKAFVRDGVAFIITTAKLKKWKKLIAAYVLEDSPVMISKGVPLKLAIGFFFARPKSHLKVSGELRKSAPALFTKKPDLTNLTKGVEDALTGILWHDDAQIIQHEISKEYEIGELKEGIIFRVSKLRTDSL